MAQTSILVVEDEYIVAKDIEARLKHLGYQVLAVVGSGEEAIEQARQHAPALVLMDILLKGDLDGIATAERIRKVANVPVVYLTAFTDEHTLRRAQVTHAFGYLLKPFEERELHITIEMAIYKHKMECQLRESQQRLITTLRSIADGVIATDATGCITFLNPLAEDLTGWSAEEAASQALLKIFNVKEGRMREEIEKALRDGASSLSSRAEEAVLVTREGVEVPIGTSASPILDDREGVSGVVVVFRDITERRNAERALRQSEERYREFFEDDLTGDYVAEPDGTIIDCNPAFVRILGFGSVEEARGSNVHALYPDSRAREQFLEYLRVGTRLTYYEKELRTRSGHRVHVVENAIGVFDGRGNLLRYKGYMFDDTVRKQLEEQLHQSQKMESIGTMASGIAHDFNNIINNVLGFATQLKKHTGDPEKILKYAGTIEKSAARGAELSAQLLSFARVGQRENKPVDVGQILEEVAALCTETFPKSIRIGKGTDRPLGRVLGDHGSLYQVLLNLCVNARDAIQEKGNGTPGTITLEARNTVAGDDISAQLIGGEEARCVELRVTDDGGGIPREIREKIFDPFFTTKERGKGTGLGLSVVYSIVRNHRGVLLLDTKEGEGSTFRIVLPAIDAELAPQTCQPSPALERGKNEVVLVVDDEESMRELARDLLEEAGYRVMTADSGSTALDLYRSNPGGIDLVVLDLVMPGLDGGTTYEQLKRLNASVKVFFCTGFMPDLLVSTLLKRENIPALRKPFQPDEFVRVVRQMLDRH